MKEKNEYSYPLSIWHLDIVNGQRGFAIDRTTTLQISKMENEIYGSLVTTQYHVKCNSPLYRKFTSSKIAFILPVHACLFSNSNNRKDF